jgi:glutamyl-tRNA(Gln) amidotransferase subunit E
VTYPEFKNPDEVKEGADYIRFLNRASGKVRTGVGSTRADVNVSCKGGTRVEIKGVAHTSWMPELTHVEAFRQFALLAVRDRLNAVLKDTAAWKMTTRETKAKDFKLENLGLTRNTTYKVYLVNLPGFGGVMSHFTQPGRMFADEFSDRLKVIACIEKPNMVHSEMADDPLGEKSWEKVRSFLGSAEGDAQIIFWGPEDDIKTALETIDERARMAFTGVPNETRKSFPDGTTMFERVLPGADRMYPDTDSAPIPLDDSEIDAAIASLPKQVSERIGQMTAWRVPQDAQVYVMRHNLVPLLERAQTELGVPARFTACLLAHSLKHLQGQYPALPDFSSERIYDMLKFLTGRKIDIDIAKRMLPHLFQHPKMDFESILVTIGYKQVPVEELLARVPFLVKKYQEIRTSARDGAGRRWIMGNLGKQAVGNISLKDLSESIHIS